MREKEALCPICFFFLEIIDAAICVSKRKEKHSSEEKTERG